jgi:hypothetical protein
VGSSGKNGALNHAIQMRQSVVIGHSYSGVQYNSNGRDIIFVPMPL